jgi:hypothetical protein
MPKYSRYSRKHKRGGRPPNTRSTDNAQGNSNSNGQRVEYTEPENSDRVNNIVEEPRPTPRQPAMQVDPGTFGLNKEEMDEYNKKMQEGNLKAYRAKYGRKGEFNRIYDENDEDNDDDEYPDQFDGGRRRRKTTKRRKSTKRRKTMKRRKTTKRRKY